MVYYNPVGNSPLTSLGRLFGRPSSPPPSPLGRLARRPSRPLPCAAHLAHPTRSSPTLLTLGRAPPPATAATPWWGPLVSPTPFPLPPSLPPRSRARPSLSLDAARPPLPPPPCSGVTAARRGSPARSGQGAVVAATRARPRRPRRPGAGGLGTAPWREHASSARRAVDAAASAPRRTGARDGHRPRWRAQPGGRTARGRGPSQPRRHGARRSRPGRRPRPRRLRRGRVAPARVASAWARPWRGRPGRGPLTRSPAASRGGGAAAIPRGLRGGSARPRTAQPWPPLVRSVAKLPSCEVWLACPRLAQERPRHGSRHPRSASAVRAAPT
jgi:hypothetical protein